jgi:ribosome maturation factor RimP
MALTDKVAGIVEPLLPALGLELYDIEHNGGNLRVTVDCEGGVTLEQLAEATRVVGRALDDADPMPGSYTLEVSSPGVERKLRTPAHFAGAIGEEVSIKLGPHVDSDRRVRGVLLASDDEGVVVVDELGGELSVAYADITRASTVFVWEPTPKPGSPEARARAAREAVSGGATNDKNDPERRAAAR